jgi:hypothetical protein
MRSDRHPAVFAALNPAYGFMERPHILDLLTAGKSLGCTVDLDDVTYYVGHETVIRRVDHMGLPGWQEAFFAVMERNAVHVSDFFSCRPIRSSRSVGRSRFEAPAEFPSEFTMMHTCATHWAGIIRTGVRCQPVVSLKRSLSL